MQATRLSEEDERRLEEMKGQFEIDYPGGLMRMTDSGDPERCATFHAIFKPSGETDILIDYDRLPDIAEDVLQEFAIRHLLMKEAMDASAA